MKHFIKTTIITAGLSLTPLFAGAGHNHGEHGHSHTKKEMSKSDIQINAKKYLLVLVEKKKIDTSWSNASMGDTEKKRFGHHIEWVVSFSNPKTKDKTKQTLYIFLYLSGDVTGANHSGK